MSGREKEVEAEWAGELERKCDRKRLGERERMRSRETIFIKHIRLTHKNIPLHHRKIYISSRPTTTSWNFVKTRCPPHLKMDGTEVERCFCLFFRFFFTQLQLCVLKPLRERTSKHIPKIEHFSEIISSLSWRLWNWSCNPTKCVEIDPFY